MLTDFCCTVCDNFDTVSKQFQMIMLVLHTTLARLWYKFGKTLTRNWLVLGTILLYSWYNFGTICIQFDTNLTHLWHNFDMTLINCWAQIWKVVAIFYIIFTQIWCILTCLWRGIHNFDTMLICFWHDFDTVLTQLSHNFAYVWHIVGTTLALFCMPLERIMWVLIWVRHSLGWL